MTVCPVNCAFDGSYNDEIKANKRTMFASRTYRTASIDIKPSLQIPYRIEDDQFCNVEKARKRVAKIFNFRAE
jgi:hypothetical protein